MNKPNPGKPTIEECLADVKFVDRFLSKFDIPDDYADECWIWKGGLENYTGINRYGRVNIINIKLRHQAHRVSFCYYIGSLIKDLVIDHLCRNTSCVNPWHLEQVTVKENTRRGYSPGSLNSKKTHCPQGHEYTEENTLIYKGQRRCRVCDRFRRNKTRRALSGSPSSSTSDSIDLDS